MCLFVHTTTQTAAQIHFIPLRNSGPAIDWNMLSGNKHSRPSVPVSIVLVSTSNGDSDELSSQLSALADTQV
jgi:hypothetical protein